MEIRPRTREDSGGYLCMPLVKNVPEGEYGWKQVECPECGRPCWKTQDQAAIIAICRLEGALCTECALKKS